MATYILCRPSTAAYRINKNYREEERNSRREEAPPPYPPRAGPLPSSLRAGPSLTGSASRFLPDASERSVIFPVSGKGCHPAALTATV